MADAARSIAKDMGCKGITGPTAKNHTTLFRTIEIVLEQQCAMRTAQNPACKNKRVPTLAPRGGGRESREKESIASWKTEELAPGCAEKMLIFHREWWDVYAQLVPASEYKQRTQQLASGLAGVAQQPGACVPLDPPTDRTLTRRPYAAYLLSWLHCAHLTGSPPCAHSKHDERRP